MKKIGIILSIALLYSCNAKLIIPTQVDVDRVISKYPGYSLTELNQGKAIYEQNCDNCHRLKKPSSLSETEWNDIVPKMVSKTNKKAGKTAIDAHAQEQLLKYLITMSPKTKKKKVRAPF